jgi:hypothetical protein
LTRHKKLDSDDNTDEINEHEIHRKDSLINNIQKESNAGLKRSNVAYNNKNK